MIYAYECDRCGRAFNHPDLFRDVKISEWEPVNHHPLSQEGRGHWSPRFQKWCGSCSATIDGGRYASKA